MFSCVEQIIPTCEVFWRKLVCMVCMRGNQWELMSGICPISEVCGHFFAGRLFLFNQFPVVRLLGTLAISHQADSRDQLANGNSD